jgi:long-chain acyl-CoA synthetase
MFETRSSDEGGVVLLTGATGFVGMEVLARYLQHSDRTVCALVRAGSPDEATARVRDTLTTLFGSADRYSQRVLAVPADIETDGLGLNRRDRDRVAAAVGDIVHCAASVSFSLPLERSREINVAGTRRMLELAALSQQLGGLRRFGYVSTAYVAGTFDGEFGEDQLEVGQDFHNAYEHSKFEAEQLVRSASDRFPVQIFRPSIIVGERDTGWTVSFNVLYAPLKAFARGEYLALPGRRSAPVDVVPIDYVADAVFEIASRPVTPEAGQETYHLVAGSQASTVGRLMELSAAYFRRRAPRLLPPAVYTRLLHPLLVWTSRGKRRRALRRSEVYFPYFAIRARYDDRRARRRLEPAGISATPIEGYFDRLAGYAVRSRWGHVAIPRSGRRR